MTNRQRNSVSIIMGLAAIGYVIFLFSVSPEISTPSLYWLMFVALITITTSFGIPIGVGEVSLVSMVSLSSIFVIGLVPTALAEIFADLLYGLIRALVPGKTKWEPEEDGFSLAATTTANITMHVFSVVAAGTVFYGFKGAILLQSPIDLVILVATGAAYIATNYLLAGLFLLMRSKAYFRSLIEHLRRMVVYEAIPIVFSPILAQILTRLGAIPFLMVAVGLILIAITLRDQAKTHRDLERRIQELSSIQAVGQSLTASLDVTLISEAIYREVLKLMPASNFYLALWNAETNEINFPLVYENDQKFSYQPRVARNGLTEYVIRTKKPLLIKKNVRSMVESLNIQHIGKEALSWLGVPIMAGSEAIGMIAVQAYPVPDQLQKTYDQHHQDILSTIAAQASAAIQNAWLYTQTDEALAKRVQELNSILSTVSEGIILLDRDMKVLEINKTLCQMLAIHPTRLLNKHLPADPDNPLASLLIEKSILDELTNQSKDSHQDNVTLQGTNSIQAGRTISPVRDLSGHINGWLCVFRDMTEELRLDKIKEDLTRMLVHDLRSPVVTIQGGLDMIEVMINDNDPQAILEMVEISKRGSNRILEMINELLNITRLESGEFMPQTEVLDLTTLLEEESLRFQPVLQQENLTIVQNLDPNLPKIQADPELLHRVIHNIIDNAIKYSPDGSEIEVWGKLDLERGEYVLVGVRDFGPGIKPEELNLLFEKYFTSKFGKSRRRGTGLGLYFCKLAVEAHQGELWVESKWGEGSNFILRLPISQPTA